MRHGTAAEVFGTSLRLGLTSFGGPVAHLGYFERIYVRERQWISVDAYTQLVALCQLLPGPASSQLGFLIGWRRAGWRGALAAWLGFTAPSAVLMYAAAMGAVSADSATALAVLHGLKLVAVAVVAQAVWSMARRLCTTRAMIAIALLGGTLQLVAGGTLTQMLVLLLGAIGGVIWGRSALSPVDVPLMGINVRTAVIALGVFALLLVSLPLLALQSPHGLWALADVFYRAGALVFGGGHVVLPLLSDALVPPHWISADRFVAGYGLAQAVPGPMFSLSAYLGAASLPQMPMTAAAIALLAIFLPGLLIAVAGASMWSQLSRHSGMRSALLGINAAVVGILAAALVDPVWVTAIRSVADIGIAALGAALLAHGRLPPLGVLVLCTVLGATAA
ncbi:chromate efflux transporter [Sinimarinibacterium sp. CAU 1509]|nr:chromate efflux transporter [Sinimarinibacterium sp. CAU 1509]